MSIQKIEVKSILSMRETSAELCTELKRRLETAVANARLIDAVDSEMKRRMEQQKIDIETLQTLKLEFDNTPYNVVVEKPQDYMLLIILAMRQLLITNYGLTDEDLDSDEYQEYYREWYEENITKHYYHEMGHYNGAINNSTLKCRLGVSFTRQENGRISFFPITDFEGSVSSVIYREKILLGPDNLSAGDKIAAGID